MGDDRFVDNTPVLVRYPLTDEQARADLDRDWPWLPGRILTQAGPSQWRVRVDVDELAGDERNPYGSDVGDVRYPTCVRGPSELRQADRHECPRCGADWWPAAMLDAFGGAVLWRCQCGQHWKTEGSEPEA